MSLHRNLVRAVLIYIGFFVVVSLVFSLAYYSVAIANNDASPFYKWIYFSIMTFAAINYPDVNAYSETWNIIAVQYLVNSIFVPIISGLNFLLYLE